jgi:hypothetical protein
MSITCLLTVAMSAARASGQAVGANIEAHFNEHG